MIIKAEELPDNEKVYLKKGFDGWKVVYPIKNPDTGKINWFNIFIGGNWGIFIKTLLIIMIILAISYSYYHDTKQCRDLISNLCDYYPKIGEMCFQQYSNNPLANVSWGFEEVKGDGGET